jgi:hypothetical protein
LRAQTIVVLSRRHRCSLAVVDAHQHFRFVTKFPVVRKIDAVPEPAENIESI